MMNQTSLEAFKKYKGTWGKRHQEICELLAREGPMSSKLISMKLGLHINQVTGRITELRSAGVLHTYGKVMGDYGVKVNVWGI